MITFFIRFFMIIDLKIRILSKLENSHYKETNNSKILETPIKENNMSLLKQLNRYFFVRKPENNN